ncbi:TPA: hypothetical protein ACSCXL_000301 [Aeromonas veronii]
MTDRQQIDAEMERDIEDLGLTAPRVTPDQIEALMRGVRYEVQVVPGTTTTLATAIAANFNAELGAKYAIKDAEAKARQELWKLEGWRLKCHLEEMSGPRVGGATLPIISTRIAVAEGEIVVCSVGENEQQHQVAVDSAKKQYLSEREARLSERF